MRFLNNGALWIAATGVAVFWIVNAALGTDSTRDLMDLIALFMSLYLSIKLVPHAWRAFVRGGEKDNWRMLISNCLFWAGIAASSIWAFSFRYYDRPDWMAYSPLNGFFRYWIVAAAFLAISATTSGSIKIPQDRLYYVFMGLVAGFALCAIIVRTAWPA